MPEFWSYSFADFVLFTPRVYYRLFETRNAALWPGQLMCIGLGLTIVFLLARPTPSRLRLVLSIFGAMWLWISWSFFWRDFASINWAAAYIAPVIALQGVLLIGAAITDVQSDVTLRYNFPSVAALVLLAFAVVGYPLIAPAIGRSWFAAEVFGIAPDPTAIATLASLVLVNGRVRWLAMLVPGVWCVLSGLTLSALDAGEYFVAPVCALSAIALMYARARH